MSKKQPIARGCICLTCGIRNDFTHPDGYCQNGHDNWLEGRDVRQRNATFQLACSLSGMTASDLTKAFMHKSITCIPMYRHIWDEVEQIMVSNNPFDWDSIEINDWELGYRMIRTDGDAICPICKKMIKEHPMETRTKGDPWLHQVCYGIWAKT